VPRDDYVRGRLVTPSPGLEAVYTSLGGSNTHCEVRPFTGGSYTCRSSDPLNDSQRHLDHHYRVITCPSCRTGSVVNGEVVDYTPVRPPGMAAGWIVADGFRLPIVEIRLQGGQTVFTAEVHGPVPAVDVGSFDIHDEDDTLMWHVMRPVQWAASTAGLTVVTSLHPPPARRATPVDDQS